MSESALQVLAKLSANSMSRGLTIYCIDGKYFCSVPCEIKDGACLIGHAFHCNTIEQSAKETLESFYNQTLVFNASSEHRKEIFFYKAE